MEWLNSIPLWLKIVGGILVLNLVAALIDYLRRKKSAKRHPHDS